MPKSRLTKPLLLLVLSACGDAHRHEEDQSPSAPSDTDQAPISTPTDGGSALVELEPAAPETDEPPLTDAELQAYVEAKDTKADGEGTLIGTFEVFTRKRACENPVGPWIGTTSDELATGRSPSTLHPTPASGEIYAFRKSLLFLAFVPGSASAANGEGYLSMRCGAGVPQDGLRLAEDCAQNPHFRFTGSLPYSPKNLTDLSGGASTFFVFPGEHPATRPPIAASTNMIKFRGRAYRNGKLHLVTDTGQACTGAGMHQLSFIGQLQGL